MITIKFNLKNLQKKNLPIVNEIGSINTNGKNFDM